jgi:hypothetical protein
MGARIYFKTYINLDLISTFLLRIFQKHRIGSDVRPLTKICEFIVKDYWAKDSYLRKYLSTKQIDSYTEVNFDRLISQRKVAIKVYAMETTFLF